MNKSELIGDGPPNKIYIHYTEALELIQDIQEKRDTLGLELSEWIRFGDDVVGMLCDLFDIEEPEVI